MVKLSDTGYWEIWIDDLDGELAMVMDERADLRLEVVEADVFKKLLAERDLLQNALNYSKEQYTRTVMGITSDGLSTFGMTIDAILAGKDPQEYIKSAVDEL